MGKESGFNAGQLGMQAAANTVDALFGIALEGHNDKRQLRQQGKLQDLQIKGNKEITDYNMMKQLEMWKNTSYPAQLKMMEAAGLNPGLMYGMGGGGGQSVGSGGGGVSGAQAPSGGGEIMGMMSKSNLMMQAAQIENIKAQTENIKTDTVKKGGVDTQEGLARIKKLGADTTNTEEQTKLTRIQQRIDTVAANIAEDTEEEAIGQIENAWNRAIVELGRARIQFKVDEATEKNRIETVGAQLANIYADSRLKQIMGNKTERERQAIGEWIAIEWQKVYTANDANTIKIADHGQRNDLASKGLDQREQDEVMDLVKQIASILVLKGVVGGGGQAPIRGFHNR